MTDQGEQAQPRFEDFDLSDEMMAALEHAGYEAPTPVQAGIIPNALDGLDLIGQAQTGTGKTAAYAIPLAANLLLKPDYQGLILLLSPASYLHY